MLNRPESALIMVVNVINGLFRQICAIIGHEYHNGIVLKINQALKVAGPTKLKAKVDDPNQFNWTPTFENNCSLGFSKLILNFYQRIFTSYIDVGDGCWRRNV